MNEVTDRPWRPRHRSRNAALTVVVKPSRTVPLENRRCKPDGQPDSCPPVEASPAAVPPLVRLRELHPDNLAYAVEIMKLEGRYSSIRADGV